MSTQTTPSPITTLPPCYKRNLLLLGLLGVALCWWVYYFTDWFEVFSSLLALGGIFSWLAFMGKVLPEERVKGIQSWADIKIFNRRGTWVVAFTLTIVLGLFAWCWGTIEVQGLRAGGPVRISRANGSGAKDEVWEMVSTGGKLRSVLWSPPWRPARMLVKVSGLPDRAETVGGLRRVKLQIPDDFKRPALLLRSTVGVAQQMANQPKVLIVRYKQDERRIEFRGSPLWINCDADVEIPIAAIANWRTEMDKQNASQLFGEWMNPPSLDRPNWKLQAGDRVEFELRDGQDKVVACTGVYTVRAQPERADARQVGVLDVKEVKKDDSGNAKCAAGFAVSVAPE